MTTLQFSSTPARTVRLILGALLLGVLLAFAGPAQPAAAACGGVTQVGTEADLNLAITTFNGASSPCVFTIQLTQDINLTASTTHINNTASGVQLIIEGDGHVLDGQDISGVLPLFVAPDTTVTINNIIITRGHPGDNGGGVFNAGILTINNSTISHNLAAGEGGGISNAGTLVVNNSTITGNTVGGGIEFGGGISSGSICGASGCYKGGTVTINNSAITNNDGGGDGGAIFLDGENISATISNTTISGNKSRHRGAIYNWGSTLLIESSTIVNNTGREASGLYTYRNSYVRPIRDGQSTVRNSIVLGNGGVPACGTYIGTIVSAGHNLSNDSSCGFTATGDQQNVTTANLGPLADNGGSTFTHALLGGSAAIDAGSTTLTTDQRGQPRPFGLADDIGAYESQVIGTIIIAKQTAPTNQGDFDFSHNITATTTFTLAGGQSETFLNVAPGTYTVTEEIEAGWRLVDLRCDDGASARPSSGSTLTRTATIEVELGETVTCTFTNGEDDIIFVQKQTVPAGGSGFDFSVSDGLTTTAFSLDDGGLQALDVVSGTYTLTETDPGPDYTLAAVNCTVFGPGANDESDVVGDLTSGSVELTLGNGQAAFCLFENEKVGTITVVKEANPSDGTDFDFTLRGDASQDFTLSHAEAVTFTLPVGDYEITEVNLPSGWDNEAFSCLHGDSLVGRDLNTLTAFISLAPGDNITCIFRNVQTGTITIVKDADPADDTQFDFEIDGSLPFSNTLFSLQDPTQPSKTFTDVVPGVYGVGEDALAGWALTDIVCQSATGDSDFLYAVGLGGVNIELARGDDVTCMFTNTELGSITIIKNADPEDDTPFAFTSDLGDFTLSDPTTNTIVFTGLLPGPYVFTETLTSGWERLIGCDGANWGSDTQAGRAEVFLDAGDDATCIFTNTKLGSITIIKNADPADDTPFAFTSDLGDFTLSDPTTNTKVFTDVLPGTYVFTETVTSGWKLWSVQCNVSKFSDLDTGRLELFPGPGDNVTCTFVNKKVGSITIIKDADPEDDTPFAFTSDLGDFTLSDPTTNTKVFSDVLPGTYVFTETVTSGWKLFGVNCNVSYSFDRNTGRLELFPGPGDNLTCTFVNKKLGTIYIGKTTLPATISPSFEFTQTIDPANGPFQINHGGSSTFLDVAPGQHIVTEINVPAGWQLSDLTCNDASSATPSTVDQATRTATINVDPGESVGCTFTNEKLGTIIVVKRAVGGDATFPFTSTIPGQASFSLTTVNGVTQTQFSDLPPGRYSISETVPADWTLLPVSCNGDDPGSIDLAAGETVVCVFINLRQDTIIVKKVSIGADGRFDFTTNIPGYASFALTTTNGAASTPLTNLTPATYNISEAAAPGWQLTGAACDNGNPPNAVSLAPDQTVTCTFTNTSSSTTITIVKDSVPDSPTNFRFTGSYLGGGGGSDSQASINDFYLDDPGASNDGDAYTNSKSFIVSTGAVYSFREPAVSGFHLTAIDCIPAGSATVNLATFAVTVDTSSGSDVTCTFRNEKAAALTVRKYRESNGRIGQQAPETFLGSWSIQVKSHPTGTLVSQAATNSLGKVSFSLKPAVYKVCELQKSGWTQKVPNPAVNPCYVLTLAPASATQVDFGNCPNSSCPATVASEDGTETPAAPVVFAVPAEEVDGWVERWLATPDGEAEIVTEPEVGEETEAGVLRLYLPVISR